MCVFHARFFFSSSSVLCVSFFASFGATDDYRSHTACMTEAERYEKRTPAAKKNGGKRTPQEQWRDLVEVCQEKAPAHLQHYLHTMAQLDNVPRKEKQFRNFTANSLNLRGKGQHGEKIVTDIWNLLKTEREKQRESLTLSSSSTSAGDAARNTQPQSSDSDRRSGNSSTAVEASESAKTVSDEDLATTPTTQASPPSVRKELSESKTDKPAKDRKIKKAVKKVIKSLLKEAKDRTLTLKELRKAAHKQLSDVPKKEIKALVLDATSQQKSFQTNGKFVRLSSKD